MGDSRWEIGIQKEEKTAKKGRTEVRNSSARLLSDDI
jgi:hypothetical protein